MSPECLAVAIVGFGLLVALGLLVLVAILLLITGAE